MLPRRSDPEVLILSLLSSVETLSMERVVECLPELSWSEVFRAVDTLNRRGAITLRRRGFEYELRGCAGLLGERTL